MHPRRWGLVDVLVGFFLAQVLAVLVTQLGWSVLLPPGTALGAGLAGAAEGVSLTKSAGAPLVALLVAQLPLWAGLIGAVVYAGQVRGNGVVGDLGLRLKPLDVPLGLLAGIATQGVVVAGYGVWNAVSGGADVDLPARQLAAKADGPLGVVALALLLGVVGPITEELFYRGLLLRSLERRLPPLAALVASAVVFGAIHGQVVQFPGLVVAGLVFGALAQRSGRLGPAMAAHIGFNLTTLALLA